TGCSPSEHLKSRRAGGYHAGSPTTVRRMTDNSAHPALWPAPLASGGVDATVTVPGSKSVTNRALILAALASDPGWLRRPLRSRDTLLMAEALRSLGIGIEETASSSSSSAVSGLPQSRGESWRVIPATPQ